MVKSRLIVISLFLLLFVTVLVPTVSAEWYAPWTWNDNTFERGEGWYLNYNHGLQLDNFDVNITNLDNGKAKVCLLPKTDLKINDYIIQQSKAYIKKDHIQNRIVQPSDMELETEAGNIKKLCVDVDKVNEDYVKFGEHSTVVEYTSESVNIRNSDGDLILESQLTTEDFEYKEGKPHKILYPGYQLTHSFKIKAYDNLTNVLNNIELINMKNGLSLNRDFDIKVKYQEYIEIPTYGMNCVNESDPYSCKTYVNGSYISTVHKYMDLKYVNYSLNLTEGEEVEIGIFMTVKDKDSFDIIPTIAGIEYDFWATIEGDFLTDLQAYYQMNSSSIFDEMANYSGTNFGSGSNTGIQNNARDFDGANDYASSGIPMNAFRSNGGSSFSVTFWMYADTDNLGYIFDGGNTENAFKFVNVSASAQWDIYNGGFHSLPTTKTSWNTGQWYHILLVHEIGVGKKIYIDGTLDASDADNTITNDKVDTVLFAGRNTGLLDTFDGRIDEFGFWYADLSASASTIYNSGAAICWNCTSGGDTTPPVVELGTPSNGTVINSNSKSQDFTCKGIDDIKLDNLTFYLWNASTGATLYTNTNTDGDNNTLETFTRTVTGGTNYSWNCLAYDNSSNFAFATVNNTLIVNVIPDNAPVVTLNGPANDSLYINSPVSIPFNCTASDDINLVNVSLIINGAINSTNSTGVNSSNYLFSPSSFYDGNYLWSCQATDNSSQQTLPTARSFIVHGDTPLVDITAPANGSVITVFNQSIQLNWTITDFSLDTCWYESTELNYTMPSNELNESVTVINGYYNFTTDNVGGSVGHFRMINTPNRTISSDSGTIASWTEPLDNPNCFNAIYTNATISTNDNSGKYICFDLHNKRRTVAQIGGPGQLSWGYYVPKFVVNCGDNTTIFNYPTTNPDSIYIFLFANDTLSRLSSDNVTLFKSTDAPDITITSPVTNYATLIGGQSIDLNYTISNVTVLDDCLYSYNGVNTSLNCVTGGTGITNFTYVGSVNTLTVFANDTLSNVNSTTVTWTAETIELNYTFNSPVVEGSSETIDLYAIVSGTITSANLIYNGTSYAANILDMGDGTTKISTTYQVPAFPVDTNATFFMSLGLLTGSTANFTVQTQLVQSLIIGNCTAYNFTILNLSLFDEKTLLPLLGTIEVDIVILDNTATVQLDRASTKFYNVSNALVCSNILLNSSGNLYSLELRYFVDPTNTSTFLYAPEFYHIQQGETDSLPQTINLYDLNVNQSTEFSILYRDNNYISRPNVLLQIERKYVSEGIFRTVEIPITSSEGSTTGHFDLNNYKYRITATQFGEVLNVFDNPAIICESELAGQCTLSLNGKGNPNPYRNINEVNGIAYITTVNGSDVTVTYTIPSGETKTVRVVMQQDSSFAATTTICNQTLTSSSGSITCTADATIGDSQVLIEVSSGGYLDRAVAFFEESISDDYNLNQYIIAAFLLMILVTMFVSSPKIMVSVAVFGVALLGLLFLLNGSSIGIVVGVISWLIIAGIIILVKISKKDET